MVMYQCYNTCLLIKGLDKGEAPPPPATASPPRTPSDEEKAESVNMDIKGFNVSKVSISACGFYDIWRVFD